ncbi:MAG: hypothetical protein AAFO72_06100 [Pseudomonadota bacterium]
MDMTGEHRIYTPRDVAWAARDDANGLAECIPGCAELGRTSDTLLTSQGHAAVEGEQARLGRRVIDLTARTLAGRVADTFQADLNGAHQGAAY